MRYLLDKSVIRHCRTSPFFPTRYTRRWARRLREANFDREDAYLLSLATFTSAL